MTGFQIGAGSLLTATAMVAGFLLYVYLGSRLLPGMRRRGRPQPNGESVEYELNGLALFLLTTGLVAIGYLVFGLSLTPVLVHFGSLFVGAAAARCKSEQQAGLFGSRFLHAVCLHFRPAAIEEFEDDLEIVIHSID